MRVIGLRKGVSGALVVGTVALGIPSAAVAGPARPGMQQGTGSITGTAKGANGESLSNYTVRARNPATGQIAAQTTTNSAGTFSFTGLAPGNYVVEVVNTAGQVVGLSSALAVTAGGTAAVTVTATAAGAAAAAAGGGFSLFGLGTAASIAVIGGAAAAGIVAIVAATNNASPSK